MCLQGADIRDWPAYHISQFPLVKVLSLRDCKRSKNIMILNTNLELLKLGGGSKRADIDAANFKFLKVLSLDGVGVTGLMLKDYLLSRITS